MRPEPVPDGTNDPVYEADLLQTVANLAEAVQILADAVARQHETLLLLAARAAVARARTDNT